MKKAIRKQVKEDKALKKERKKHLASMSKEARLEEISKERLARKQQKEQQKQEWQTLSKTEKRKIKKERRMYRKIKRRPIRFTGWGIVVGFFLIIAIQFGPMVSDILATVTGKHITIDTESEESIAAREYGDQLSEEIVNEGIVLLKNENDYLPLKEKKVNVFGFDALTFRYGGGGSGSVDTSRAIDLFEGLSQAGIEYNEELYTLHRELAVEYGITEGADTGLLQVVQGMMSKEEEKVPTVDYLNQDVLEQAKHYSNHAVIVLASQGMEASDMTVEQLQLSSFNRELIEKVSDHFDNITIVVNAGNTLELGFVEEYEAIQSVVWVGTPGPYGAKSLGNVLAGNINPSGRLTDTYVYDVSSAPAMENFGDYKFDNVPYSFVNYEEGIYVGYRFYETYFQNDEEGYQKTVQYPFGYGLSYTEFDWKNIEANYMNDTIEVQVEVENVGEVSGKDVVQLYFSPPYIEGGIEKSAIELATYSKTSLLEPGQTEKITMTFDRRDMASYDTEEEAYILDEGVYEINVARNVHDIDYKITYEVDEKVVYKEDQDTGVPYANQFNYAEGDITYLSRNDWQQTYPSDQEIDTVATDEIVNAVNKDVLKTASEEELPTFGKDNGIMLDDLKGLSFNDSKWDDFLDQLTLEEMFQYVTEGAYKTNEIERLGIPKAILMDGPAGFSYFFKPVKAAAYPSELVLASTWNDELSYRMGEAIGKEARAYGIHGWYAPGMNIHRTALGGRNFEYFSEDPLLTGKIAAALTRGAQDQGIIVFMKHFAMNEQETNARSGLIVQANEQAIREIYLKPFEITVKEADVLGAMSSFTMIGGKWSGANEELLQHILREEWGFDGFITSDAVFGFMDASAGIVTGNDLMLDVMTPSKNYKLLEEAYEENPALIANSVRESVHRILYTLTKTYLFEQ